MESCKCEVLIWTHPRTIHASVKHYFCFCIITRSTVTISEKARISFLWTDLCFLIWMETVKWRFRSPGNSRMGFERKKIPKCSEILRQKESWQICLIFLFDTGTNVRSQRLQSRLVCKAQKAAEGSVGRWRGDGERAGREVKAQLGRQELHRRARLRNCGWRARQTAGGRLLSTIAVYGL